MRSETIVHRNAEKTEGLLPDANKSLAFDKGSKWNSILFLLAILAVNAFFLNYNAFRCFSSYDMSTWLDVPWRIYRGQRPYIDFWLWMGPVYPHMVSIFFHMFGFGKLAILAHLVFINSIVIIATFLMLYKRIEAGLMWTIVLLSGMAFYWNMSFPYHDQSGQFWGVLIVALLSRAIPFKERWKAFLVGSACGLLAIISLMTKTNIGGAYFLAVGLVLLFSGLQFYSLSGFAVGALLGAVLIWRLFELPPEFVDQTFRVYRSHTFMRFQTLSWYQTWLRNFYWAPTLLVIGQLVFHKNLVAKLLPYVALFLGTALVGILAAGTSSMIPTANYPIWGITMAMAAIVTGNVEKLCGMEKHRIFHSLSRIGLRLIILGMCFISVVKGFRLTAWRQIGKSPIGTYEIQTPPLTGWLAEEMTGKAIDDLTAYINQNVPKEDSLLVFTALQILYPLTGRDSFRNVPIAFAPPTWSLGEREQYEYARKTVLANPPDWMIIHTEVLPSTTMLKLSNNAIQHAGLEAFISSNYKVVHKSGPFKVLRKI